MKYCEEIVDKICAYIVAGTTQKDIEKINKSMEK